MTNDEKVEFWVEGSDRHFASVDKMYKSQQYDWALFVGHLTIEKLLKAIYTKNNPTKDAPPKIHNLVTLAEKADIPYDDEKFDMLDKVTNFNIEARYEEYKNIFYKLCTKQFADENIKIIKELRTWLKNILTAK